MATTSTTKIITPWSSTVIYTAGMDQTAKAQNCTPDVVNIMAMDYGSYSDNGGQMGLDAAKATEQQLASMGLASKIGVTPMIGDNDVSSEIFKLADAQTLVNFADADSNVARLAYWSVSRDNGNGAGQTYASIDTSGIAQTPYQFASIFAKV